MIDIGIASRKLIKSGVACRELIKNSIVVEGLKITYTIYVAIIAMDAAIIVFVVSHSKSEGWN